jgi:hypothetical protein
MVSDEQHAYLADGRHLCTAIVGLHRVGNSAPRTPQYEGVSLYCISFGFLHLGIYI